MLKSNIYFVQPALIIIGWAFVYHLARSTSRRNESRGLLDRTLTIIGKLEDYGHDAWSGGFDRSYRTKAIVTSVSARLDLLEEYILLLSKRKLGEYDQDWIVELRHLMTHDFESKEEMDEDKTAARQLAISRECRRFMVQLEKNFRDLYS